MLGESFGSYGIVMNDVDHGEGKGQDEELKFFK